MHPHSQDSELPDPDFPQLMIPLRPRLHRYCARMTGSVLDGEDLVQETLIKANASYDAREVRNLEPWLFRIAHNTTLDFLRKRGRECSIFEEAAQGETDCAPDPYAKADSRVLATAALSTFMRLAPAQRSAVILTDVLGYEAEEAAAVIDSTVPAIKAALHRGRARLREMAAQLDASAPALSAGDQALLADFADKFNARDWDGLRDSLAQSVRLHLVARRKPFDMTGGEYFTNYAAKTRGLRMKVVAIEGKPALWVSTEGDEGAGALGYLVLVEFGEAGKVVAIRDFRWARYVGETLAASA